MNSFQRHPLTHAISILDEIRAGRFLLDGGMGTSLLGLDGLKMERIALAALEHPEAVRSLHRGFLESGSRCIQTATFGSGPIALRAKGLGVSPSECNQAAAGIALKLAESVEGAFVAGCIGPATPWCEERPHPSDTELLDNYGEQGRALAESGVHMFALETFADLKETELAIQALRGIADLPISACLTFSRRAEAFVTLSGEPIADGLLHLAEQGADLLGVNCGEGSAVALELVRELHRTGAVPHVVKPNAGLPQKRNGQWIYGQDPADFARDMLAVLELGVLAVGGCCGADHKFIESLAGAMNS
ncbi:MAG: methionine synthase I (cobalamin-dependent) [Candidatus Paceibacteria bacterium]